MNKRKVLQKKIFNVSRRFRGLQRVTKALLSTKHPLLAHLIPIRRCNLSCTYCNEFDNFSPPVLTKEMIRRVDTLAKLGTAVVTIRGGEPFLHPDLDLIIAQIRSRKMLSGVITNGYLLNEKRITQLIKVGLEYMQISIDNIIICDNFIYKIKLLL